MHILIPVAVNSAYFKEAEIRETGRSWNGVKGIAGDCNAWIYSEIMVHVYQSTQQCIPHDWNQYFKLATCLICALNSLEVCVFLECLLADTLDTARWTLLLQL